MAQDRRRFQRVALDSPFAVLLGESANTFVCDLCEGGLGASELALRMPGEVIPFAFELPEGSGRIRGQAEIIWRSESNHRAGLRFVELADSCRERLAQWISTRAWTMKQDGVETGYLEPADVSAPMPRPTDSAPLKDASKTNNGWLLPAVPAMLATDFEGIETDLVAGASTPSAGSTRTIGIALAVVLLASGIGFLVSSSHGTRRKLQTNDSVAAQSLAPTSSMPGSVPTSPAIPAAALPAAVEAPATASVASARSAVTTPATPAPLPAMPPPAAAKAPAKASVAKDAGFVLQVGAMTREGNADALATELQHKRVPAFVFRREGDSFYRVAVGPFRTSETPVGIQDTLEKEGLKPFKRPWSAAQE